jgi:1-acyl-sn-glycerol-3-phosphate acyltransferase
MRRIIAFLLLATVKIVSHVFYRGNFKWITEHPEKPFKKARLIVFLNHTSLYEPIYLQAVSYDFLWRLAGNANVPGADITLKRPIVGTFWKLMVPNIASVTRKKDSSWSTYLNSIRPESIVMIAPEGRMKRLNGLDKRGNPMTVQGGVADIIESMNDGDMLLCFSGGLHHIQSPGQHFPKLFRPISMNFAYFNLKEYKNSFTGSPREKKLSMVQDLQRRLENDCPKVTWNK